MDHDIADIGACVRGDQGPLTAPGVDCEECGSVPVTAVDQVHNRTSPVKPTRIRSECILRRNRDEQLPAPGFGRAEKLNPTVSSHPHRKADCVIVIGDKA